MAERFRDIRKTQSFCHENELSSRLGPPRQYCEKILLSITFTPANPVVGPIYLSNCPLFFCRSLSLPRTSPVDETVIGVSQNKQLAAAG